MVVMTEVFPAALRQKHPVLKTLQLAGAPVQEMKRSQVIRRPQSGLRQPLTVPKPWLWDIVLPHLVLRPSH